MSGAPNILNLALRHLSPHNPPPLTPLRKLEQIHALLIVSGVISRHTSTRILLHCLSLPFFPPPYALSIFAQIRPPDVFTYNALIRGFSSDPQKAVSLYSNMRRDDIPPNKHTFPLLLKSKARIPFQIFGHAIQFGLGPDPFVRNSLLSSFAICGLVEDARKLFDEMTQRDLVSYTALMDVYIKNKQGTQALDLFLEMRECGVCTDGVAVVSALSAAGMSGSIWLGKWIHGFYVETGRVVRDVYVGSALVDMYSKCGLCEDALKAFHGMPRTNVVSWGALLAGFLHNEKFNDVLLLFRKMLLLEKTKPNKPILASALAACAGLGSCERGRWIHGYLVKLEHETEICSVLGTALIDMYAKCGCMTEAFRVFARVAEKDVYPWTALIFGSAVNGDARGALHLFHQMVGCGVRPNEVTLLAVLSACAHGGLVDEGKAMFAEMERVYGVGPTEEHCSCMVDLLGRAGRLREAVELIGGGIQGNGPWSALLGACAVHGDYELGKVVGNNYLMRVQPREGEGGRYALVANLCSGRGDWKGVAEVRKKMREGGGGKDRGCSWIEMGGIVREFYAFGESGEGNVHVYNVVNQLTEHMKQQPFVLEDGLLEI
ncbi:pentatricopeptide repeat (PPR) superfamily protein [Striga asiatica]|uniref:Pentatricopeptide repeat (PPR) superfamily protein n=1 Tax=Striga asiatica TaxID=4170 RepID=A0A5A7RLK1_STRAF|nr:pentatricopeptide repeat (PPR) superfamily protein [Striga asiatica]